MKNGIIKNIISTTKCAAGTGEFIIQQLQRRGMTIEEGIKSSLNGDYTQLATRCSVHCKQLSRYLMVTLKYFSFKLNFS